MSSNAAVACRMPPPVISLAPSALPDWIRLRVFSRWMPLICGPCRLPGVHGSPTGKFSIIVLRISRPSA